MKIPNDWNWVKLKDISESIQYGYTESSSKDAIGPKFLRITDIQENTVNWDNVPYCRIDEEAKLKYLLRPGDLVFARTGATVGKSFLINGNIPEAVFASYLIRVRVGKEVKEKFLSYFFHSIGYWSQITDGQVGIGQPNVNGTKLGQLSLPLPPLPIQQAIVSKIEELFSELDKGIENLKLVQQQLKTYRQAVLKWAFEGKLTNGRGNGSYDVSVEDEIMMAAEPEVKYQAATKLNGKTHQPFESSDNGELPEGWEWVMLGLLFSESPQNGLYKPSTAYGSGTQIIRIDGFYEGKLVDNYQFKRVQLSKEEIETYQVTKGDVLINRVNSMPYLGKCGYVKHLAETTVFESNIMKLKVNEELALPEYCSMYLSSKKGTTELRKNAKQAVNQASINQKDVSNVIIPIPSIKEQHVVIQAIESRLSVAEKMEESIEHSLRQAEALRQSILKKAFEGRLV